MLNQRISNQLNTLHSLLGTARNFHGGNTHPHIERIAESASALYGLGEKLYGSLPQPQNSPSYAVSSLSDVKIHLDAEMGTMDALIEDVYKCPEMSVKKEFDPMGYDQCKSMLGSAMMSYTVARLHIA